MFKLDLPIKILSFFSILSSAGSACLTFTHTVSTVSDDSNNQDGDQPKPENSAEQGALPSEDISHLLRVWKFEAGQPNVRQIIGEDGETRVQIRLDLGVLQMFADGRPDGERPHGYESLLEYFEDSFEPEEEGAAPERDSLSGDECSQLRDEAVQYYHRYMALLVLEDFDGVVRDTTRNLRVFDLCRTRAEDEDDREALEQYRPYVMMIRARALASQLVKDGEPRAAALSLDSTLEQLRVIFSDRGEAEAFEKSGEVEMLRQMREQLSPKLPKSRRAELREQLEQAVAQENYEQAAKIRDELKSLDKA